MLGKSSLDWSYKYNFFWHILGAELQLTFGSGSGTIHFNNVVCNGSQPRLIDCQTSTATGRCYYNIAGVNCGFDTLRKSEVLLVTTMSLISWHCSKHSPTYKDWGGDKWNKLVHIKLATTSKHHKKTWNYFVLYCILLNWWGLWEWTDHKHICTDITKLHASTIPCLQVLCFWSEWSWKGEFIMSNNHHKWSRYDIIIVHCPYYAQQKFFYYT